MNPAFYHLNRFTELEIRVVTAKGVSKNWFSLFATNVFSGQADTE